MRRGDRRSPRVPDVRRIMSSADSFCYAEAGPPPCGMGAPDMSATKASQIVLAARPQGKPRLADFRLEETAIPTPGPGQVLLRVQYLSLDPYMRGRMDDRKSYQPPVSLGAVMPGEAVATVVSSRHPACLAGDIV